MITLGGKGNMIKRERVTQIVKEIAYRIHIADDINNVGLLKSILKLDSVLIEAMADMLEQQFESGNYNNVLVHELFKFYADIAKAYNLLWSSIKAIDLNDNEKKSVLYLLEDLNEIDDSTEIIDRINKLLYQNQIGTSNIQKDIQYEQDESSIYASLVTDKYNQVTKKRSNVIDIGIQTNKELIKETKNIPTKNNNKKEIKKNSSAKK